MFIINAIKAWLNKQVIRESSRFIGHNPKFMTLPMNIQQSMYHAYYVVERQLDLYGMRLVSYHHLDYYTIPELIKSYAWYKKQNLFK